MTSPAAIQLEGHPLGGPWLAWVTDPAPADKDVKAGWLAFAIFLLLIVAVVLLCVSLVKQLRKARAAQDAGVFDDPVDDDHETPSPR